MGSRWLTVAEARALRGVRLVLSVGVPGPWGEAAKGLLHVKGVPFHRVIQTPAQPNEELVAWTGASNAPQLVVDDEPPRDRFADLVLRAERLAPEPALIPADPRERALLFGLLHELCGEDGFGWSRRLSSFAPLMTLPPEHPGRRFVQPMADRYGWSDAAAQRAPARAAEVVRLFAEQLAAQQARGREYLLGDALSALDVYWAAFAALIAPLPEELCPMPAAFRASYMTSDPLLLAAVTPELLVHRDRVYRRHLELPVDLGPR